MARRSGIFGVAPTRGLWGLFAMTLLVVTPARADADLNGRWRFEWLTTSIETITQVGSSVSFPLTLIDPPGGSAAFTGTVTGTNMTTLAPDPYGGGCDVHLDTTIAADELSMQGVIYTLCFPPQGVGIRAERCECFDGNSNDGDGCSSECRIETCYSCSGDPSVCTPLADGSPCDDQMACTTGETCTSAVCAGGGPAPPPCIDMTGGWLMRFDFPDDPGFPVPSDAEYPLGFTQRNTDLETASMRGSIDTASGYFSLTDVNVDFCGANRLTGTVAADGLTLTGSFLVPEQISFSTCINFQAVVTGTRCGGATLDPNEECDDGNDTNGDGCSAQCQVEQCFTCSGTPSACTPKPDSTPCTDGDLCTTGDACQAGVCTTTPVVCAPCSSCDVTGQCVATPRSGCLSSTTPSRTSLAMRDTGDPASDTLTWNWRKGQATDLMDLGDPTDTTAYALCVYDESTSPPTAIVAAVAPQVACPDAECWTSRRSGFTYENSSGSGSGLTRIDLRAKSNGRAKVTVRGKGAALDPPTAPLALPLRVQLQAIDAVSNLQTCFEAEYTSPGVRVNDNGIFRGRATGP